MKCVYCRSDSTAIKKTENKNGGISRTRFCSGCKKSFPTFHKPGKKERVQMQRKGCFVKTTEEELRSIDAGEKTAYRVAKDSGIDPKTVSNRFKKWKAKR